MPLKISNEQIIQYLNISKRIKVMQTAKGSHTYKFEHYEVTLTVFSEKKLQISVIDTFQKVQFYQKLLTLSHIGTTTLTKALQRSVAQIKIGMKINKTSDSAVLQIDVLVASLFLKPVQQVIYLKKLRDISQSQILKSAITLLSTKVKTLKDNNLNNTNTVVCGQVEIEEKAFSGAGFQSIASINLKKGKYMLTLSFLLKATNTWMYLYLQQGAQTIIQNQGFYLPNNSNYFSFVFRKIYNVAGNEENVVFNTNSASSYQIRLKNIVLTAQKISQ